MRSSPSAKSKANNILIPLEDRDQSGKEGKFLLAECLGKGEQLSKSNGPRRGAKSPGNFVFEFCRLDGPLGTIVIWWDIRVSHESKDPAFMLDQTLLQSALLLVSQRQTVQSIQRILVILDDGFSLLGRNPCLPDLISSALTFA